MKLNVATTVLASAAIMSMTVTSVSAVYSEAAGTCLSAVMSNAGKHDGDNLSDEAAYYTISSSDAEEAEYNIQTQMQSLAEALDLEFQEEGREDGGPDDELNYAMEFDDELQNALGIEDRETFEEFYRVLYELAKDGDVDRCNEAADEEEDRDEEEGEDQGEQEGEEGEDQGEPEGEEGEEGEDQDGEGRRLNSQDEQNEEQIEDNIKNILLNCGSVFEAFGVDLSNMNLDGDNDEANGEGDGEGDDQFQNALHDLSIHILIERVMNSEEFNFHDALDYDFSAGGNEEGNGGEGNYDEEFRQILERIGIDENELDEDDVMNIKLKLAVKSGALREYLEANAAFGSVVDDWEGLLQGFFQSLGIEGEFDLKDIDSYLAAYIYNIEYGLEEYGCQQAMLNEFGKSEAKDLGYIESSNFIAEFFSATAEKFTSGQTAGIVIGVLIAVGLFGVFAFRRGKKTGAKSRSSKNEPFIGGTAV